MSRKKKKVPNSVKGFLFGILLSWAQWMGFLVPILSVLERILKLAIRLLQ